MLKGFSKQEKSWMMYDWANSAYSIIVSASILPIYFKSMAENSGLSSNVADSYWGYSTSIATLVVALLAPILGTLGDYKEMKKRLFIVFFILGIFSTASLAFTEEWSFLLLLYILTTIGFLVANIFYDAFLIDITTDDRFDKISTYGFAFGYIGGSTIPFIISIILINFGPEIGVSTGTAVKFSFLLTAAWWAVFTIPLLINVKQRYSIEIEPNLIYHSFERLWNTFRHIKKYKQIFLFLIAYFFYIDGVNTIIHMAAVYGASVGIDNTTLLLALLVTQIVAFPCAIIYGKIAEKVGSHRMIAIGIGIYIIICILGYNMNTAIEFWMLAILVATSQGGIQALSRSYFGKMIPKEQSNEFFGLYDIFGKFAAIMGPALFGLFSQLTGQSRYGVLSVMILFIIGGILFIVNNHKGHVTSNA